MKLFPSAHEKLITSCVLAAVIGLAIGLIAGMTSNTDWKAALTLVSTFLGAFAAFQFQNHREAKKKLDDRVEAGNRGIFSIIRTFNSLRAFERDFIDPHRASQYRTLEILPAIGFDNHLEIDFGSLIHLVELGSPNLLGELSSYVNEVQATYALINARSKVHNEEAQRRLAEVLGDNYAEEEHSLESLKRILKWPLYHKLESLTDDLIVSVDSLVAGAPPLVKKLSDVYERNFPNHKVVRLAKQPLRFPRAKPITRPALPPFTLNALAYSKLSVRQVSDR